MSKLKPKNVFFPIDQTPQLIELLAREDRSDKLREKFQNGLFLVNPGRLSKQHKLDFGEKILRLYEPARSIVIHYLPPGDISPEWSDRSHELAAYIALVRTHDNPNKQWPVVIATGSIESDGIVGTVKEGYSFGEKLEAILARARTDPPDCWLYPANQHLDKTHEEKHRELEGMGVTVLPVASIWDIPSGLAPAQNRTKGKHSMFRIMLFIALMVSAFWFLKPLLSDWLDEKPPFVYDTPTDVPLNFSASYDVSRYIDGEWTYPELLQQNAILVGQQETPVLFKINVTLASSEEGVAYWFMYFKPADADQTAELIELIEAEGSDRYLSDSDSRKMAKKAILLDEEPGLTEMITIFLPKADTELQALISAMPTEDVSTDPTHWHRLLNRLNNIAPENQNHFSYTQR